MSFAPANSSTAYIPTYLDLQCNDEQLRIILTAYLTDLAYGINLREIAQYEQVELLNGQQFFNPTSTRTKRYGFRKVFPFSDANLVFNHDITGATIYTSISGTAITAGGNFIPIPYVSATLVTDQIQIDVTPTQVVVTKGATSPVLTNGLIILEYLKT